MALILDSGVLIAALDRRDRHHRRCRDLLEQAREALVIPAPTLPEIDYVISEHSGVGPILELLRQIEEGVFHVVDIAPEWYARVREVMDQYGDQAVGFVDASVLTITEALGEPKLATLDHRHFSVMRPRHVDTLELLP